MGETKKILVALQPVVLEVPEEATEDEIRDRLDDLFGPDAAAQWSSWKHVDEWRN